MTNEPQYVDADDPFQDTSWRYPDAPLQVALLKAGKRKHFYPGEKDSFARILKKMRLYTASASVFEKDRLVYIPTQFVLEILDWAGKENQKAGFAKIKVKTIINMCKDTDRISRWLERHKKEDEDRSGYVDDDNGW